MGKTGILGLQNLVYFSERYTELAKARSRTDKYRWALAGISITALLTSLLHLHGDKGKYLLRNCFSVLILVQDSSLPLRLLVGYLKLSQT